MLTKVLQRERYHLIEFLDIIMFVNRDQGIVIGNLLTKRKALLCVKKIYINNFVKYVNIY